MYVIVNPEMINILRYTKLFNFGVFFIKESLNPKMFLYFHLFFFCFSQMLQEISLVVSHCKLLGEEIEFLKRWGPNYNLISIDVNNTE